MKLYYYAIAIRYLIIGMLLPVYFIFKILFESILNILILIKDAIMQEKKSVPRKQELFSKGILFLILLISSGIYLLNRMNFNYNLFILERLSNVYGHLVKNKNIANMKAKGLYIALKIFINRIKIWSQGTLEWGILFYFIDQFFFATFVQKHKKDLFGNRLAQPAKEIRREKAIKNNKIYVGTTKHKEKFKDIITSHTEGDDVFLSNEQRSLHVQAIGTTGTGNVLPFRLAII